MAEILQLVKHFILAQGAMSGQPVTLGGRPLAAGMPILATAGQLTETELIRMQLQQLLDERSKKKNKTGGQKK